MGSQAATDFIMKIAEASQIADDFVDDEIQNKQEMMARLLSIAFFEIPQNPFFQANINHLSPLFATSIQIWSHSDDWGKQDKLKEFGFVYREHLEQIIVMAAYLMGGWKHARWVTNDMVDFYRNNEDQDSIEEWVEELNK